MRPWIQLILRFIFGPVQSIFKQLAVLVETPGWIWDPKPATSRGVLGDAVVALWKEVRNDRHHRFASTGEWQQQGAKGGDVEQGGNV